MPEAFCPPICRSKLEDVLLQELKRAKWPGHVQPGPHASGHRMKFAAASAAVLLLCLLDGVSAENKSYAQPDYTLYRTRDQVHAAILETADNHPGSMRVDTHAHTDGEYTATIKVVTVEPGGFTEPSVQQRKLRLLLNFGEHGRELITVEVALRLLAALGNPRGAIERSQARGQPAQRLMHLLKQCIFQVVPMENEAGRAVVEGGSLCERKNARGVDTNRNWDIHWGFREKDYDPSEEFPGSKPFSEPEVAIMHALAKDFRPHVWVNAHSGMEALFMPYDHRPAIPEGAPAEATLKLLQELNTLSCGARCVVGSGGKSVGYLAHGTATDFLYEKLGVPLSFTWEIYGDAAAHFNDCFRMFNPTDPQRYEEVVSAWSEAIFIMLELLPGHPSLPNLKIPRSKGVQQPRRLWGQKRAKEGLDGWPIE